MCGCRSRLWTSEIHRVRWGSRSGDSQVKGGTSAPGLRIALKIRGSGSRQPADSIKPGSPASRIVLNQAPQPPADSIKPGSPASRLDVGVCGCGAGSYKTEYAPTF
jgi:hypothetical protein